MNKIQINNKVVVNKTTTIKNAPDRNSNFFEKIDTKFSKNLLSLKMAKKSPTHNTRKSKKSLERYDNPKIELIKIVFNPNH